MKILIGPVAENEYYFDRPELSTQFFTAIKKHYHLSIAASRRVGKSSFMKHLIKHADKSNRILYLITESVNTPEEFFKKIFLALFQHLQSSTKLKKFFNQKSKSIFVKKIGPGGLEFEKSNINFYEELKELIIHYAEDTSSTILLIDEFSQTIENIIKDQSQAIASHFLHQCRELRIMQSGSNKIHFVFAGSIGLENLVSNISESKAINDLGNFEVPPLSREEAHLFIQQILDSDPYQFPIESQEYLFDQLVWLIPFYIQILMCEIEKILIYKKILIIDTNIIDEAFNSSLSTRNYFEHWFNRLRSVFHGPSFNTAKSILNSASSQDSVSIFEIQNILKENGMNEGRDMINTLIHDGYLSRINLEHYRFNSPLLKQWWFQNINN